MTHSYVYVWLGIVYVRHESLIQVMRGGHVCDMPYAYFRHDSLLCVTRLLYMCDMTHPYVWHDSSMTIQDSSICVTWRVYMCVATHLYVCTQVEACKRLAREHRNDHVARMNESCATREWVVTQCSWKLASEHKDVSCHACDWVMSECEWVMCHT